jgi:predicted ATP-grasp superfamily ATP-dependent carboligase
VPDLLAIAGASVRAAAMSAVRSGFQVVAAELFADTDLEEIAPVSQIRDYPDGLADWLRQLDPKPLAWMYTGALENHAELIDQMSDIAPLWGNSGNVLREVRSPWRLAETLQQAGLLYPEIRATADGLPLDGSWLAKSGRGASGSGVRAWERIEQQADVAHDAMTSGPISAGSPLSSSPNCFYQERIPGVPCSAVFVAARGAALLLGVVRQLVGEPWLAARVFQYCGAIGPWPVADATRSEICRIGEALAARFGLCGVFGVDLMIDRDERIWTIEVNPRYPASAEIVERATSVGTVAAHASACRNRSFPSKTSENDRIFHGKAILFARRPVTVSFKFDDSMRDIRRTNLLPEFADLSPPGTRIETARPVMTAFATGATSDEVIANLQDRIAAIERRLYA